MKKLLLIGLLILAGCQNDGQKTNDQTTPKQEAVKKEQSAQKTEASKETSKEGTKETETVTQKMPATASNLTQMAHIDTIDEGPITPKSVVANGDGLVIANNMMYQHSVTLYDAKTRKMTQNLSDTVDFSKFGLKGYGTISGAPVEAVWTHDGKYAYVSQYQLTDHGAEAEDNCVAGNAISPSVVYRYSAEAKDWDQVIQVGRVPKYVALTPDDSKLLVSNWCDKSLSVVDTKSHKEIERISLNSMPRGIVALPDNRTAYVTAMYANEIYKVDIKDKTSKVALQTGARPRHLVMDKAGKTMYLTVAGANELIKMDAAGKVLARTQTGAEPRSMAISPDDKALYVVNYDENTVSKFDSKTLKELQREPTGHLPIGVTYEPETSTVWVANYSGTIDVFDDTKKQ